MDRGEDWSVFVYVYSLGILKYYKVSDSNSYVYVSHVSCGRGWYSVLIVFWKGITFDLSLDEIDKVLFLSFVNVSWRIYCL